MMKEESQMGLAHRYQLNSVKAKCLVHAVSRTKIGVCVCVCAVCRYLYLPVVAHCYSQTRFLSTGMTVLQHSSLK